MAIRQNLLDAESLASIGFGDPMAAAEGLSSGVQLGRPRRDVPVPQRPYPGQAELLQDMGNMSAAGKKTGALLEEALAGIFRHPFTETFGFQRAPIGNTVEPFFEARLLRDLPFEKSRVFPVFENDRTQKDFLNEIQKAIAAAESSGKYGAVEKEIERVARVLPMLSGPDTPYRMRIELGTAAGSKLASPTVRALMRTAILAESAGTLPESAEFTVRGRDVLRKGAGPLARGRSIERLHSELAILSAKGRPVRGPLLADAVNMYARLLWPSIGGRIDRDIQAVPLQPMPTGTLGAEIARKTAQKDIRAITLSDARAAASAEFRSLSGQQQYERVLKAMRERLSAAEVAQLIRDTGVQLDRLEPADRIKRLTRELRLAHGDAAAEAVVAEAAGTFEARRAEGRGPSKTRLTRVAEKTQLVSEKDVERWSEVMKSEGKKMGRNIRNPLAVLALAGILGAAMMSSGGSQEAA